MEASSCGFNTSVPSASLKPTLLQSHLVLGESRAIVLGTAQSPFLVRYLLPFSTCTQETILASSSVFHRLGRGWVREPRSVASHLTILPPRHLRIVTVCDALVFPQGLTQHRQAKLCLTN